MNERPPDVQNYLFACWTLSLFLCPSRRAVPASLYTLTRSSTHTQKYTTNQTCHTSPSDAIVKTDFGPSQGTYFATSLSSTTRVQNIAVFIIETVTVLFPFSLENRFSQTKTTYCARLSFIQQSDVRGFSVSSGKTSSIPGSKRMQQTTQRRWGTHRPRTCAACDSKSSCVVLWRSSVAPTARVLELMNE